jgi:hypothetical protein
LLDLPLVSFFVESAAGAAAVLALPALVESAAAAAGALAPVAPAGTAKRASSSGTFSSIFVNASFCFISLVPTSIENGCIRPSTSL